MAPLENKVADSPVTVFVSSTDGTTYVHTHKAETARQVAEALIPYIGREMRGEVRNNYGHYRKCRLVLVAVDGDSVTVLHEPSGIIGTHNAFETFGNECTTVEPEPNN